MTDRRAVELAVADAHRREWARVLAATARTARDFDLAEECVQDAYAAALVAWVRDGIPDSPSAWLTTTARRRAVDAIRREARLAPKLTLLVDRAADDGAAPRPGSADDAAVDVVRDDRLRLIFMCCHPALAPEAQVALTLRLVCGISTTDVARALLVSEPTMAARLTRAKRKIAIARIPMREPDVASLPARLGAVLTVIYVVFTAGHSAPSGADLVRVDLVDEAIRLARLCFELMPDEREVAGLLALLVATDAMRATRLDDDGRIVLLEDQDRSKWDRCAIDEARALATWATGAGATGRFAIQAAIAIEHATAPTYAQTDWAAILDRYDELCRISPSPVVELNRAVALAMAVGPTAALHVLDELDKSGRLAGSHYLHAVRGHLLTELNRPDEALAATVRAIGLVGNDTERALLVTRAVELEAQIDARTAKP